MSKRSVPDFESKDSAWWLKITTLNSYEHINLFFLTFTVVKRNRLNKMTYGNLPKIQSERANRWLVVEVAVKETKTARLRANHIVSSV